MQPSPRPSLVFATCVAATAAAGCVIPVAPDFEDPEENYPPYITGSTPEVGGIITVLSGEEPPTITVSVADPNRGDVLYLQWLYDYPPYDDNFTRRVSWSTLPPPQNDGIVRDSVRFAPSCSDGISRTLTQHRLTLAIADREFVKPALAPEPESRLDTVSEGGYRDRGTWVLNMECRDR